MIGVPMYGRTFVLAGAESSGVLGEEALSAQEGGFQGPFTKADGFLGYNEVRGNAFSRHANISYRERTHDNILSTK